MDYRNLTVWQKAVEAALEAHRLAAQLPASEVHGMRPALMHAAVSVAACIAEGWSMDSEKERARLLSSAQGSLAETETLLLLCERLEWISPSEGRPLQSLLEDTGRMLVSLRRMYFLKRERAVKK
jgi:four helix bundle protein